MTLLGRDLTTVKSGPIFVQEVSLVGLYSGVVLSEGFLRLRFGGWGGGGLTAYHRNFTIFNEEGPGNESFEDLPQVEIRRLDEFNTNARSRQSRRERANQHMGKISENILLNLFFFSKQIYATNKA